jgi:hypothetical protein
VVDVLLSKIKSIMDMMNDSGIQVSYSYEIAKLCGQRFMFRKFEVAVQHSGIGESWPA